MEPEKVTDMLGQEITVGSYVIRASMYGVPYLEVMKVTRLVPAWESKYAVRAKILKGPYTKSRKEAVLKTPHKTLVVPFTEAFDDSTRGT